MDHEVGRVGLDDLAGAGLADDMRHVGAEFGRGHAREVGGACVVFTAANDCHTTELTCCVLISFDVTE